MPFVIRLLAAVATLVAVSIVTFVVFFSVPQDPALMTCGKNCSPATIEANRRALGYDKPVVEQYQDFLAGLVSDVEFPRDPAMRAKAPGSVVTCDAPCFGYSALQNQTVNDYLGPAIPITLSVSIGAFCLWVFVGVLVGILAAVKPGGWFDRGARVTTLVAYSLPTFFIGLFLINIVSIRFGILPEPHFVSPRVDVGAWVSGMVVPWITLSCVFAALYARMTRARMLEALGEDFVKTAIAKGSRRSHVVVKHAFRSALSPIVTMAGLDLGSVLAGAAITETVTNLNGVGKLGILAIQQFDLPVVVAVVLLGAASVVVLNGLVDASYGLIDPRVRRN